MLRPTSHGSDSNLSAQQRLLVARHARQAVAKSRVGHIPSEWHVCAPRGETIDLTINPHLLTVIDAASFENPVASLRELPSDTTFMVLCEPIHEPLIVEFFRAGALDVILPNETPSQVTSRLNAAATRLLLPSLSQVIQERDAMQSQLALLCGGLADSCRDLASNVREIALASEVSAILRQELDMESLLRTTLECMLKRTGPTNAAVYMPSTTGDFTLGAYANYDCPRDTAEMIFDELSDVIGPRFQDRSGVTLLRHATDIKSELGQVPYWLEDSALTVLCCRDEHECRAVIALFRDRRTQSAPGIVRTLEIMGGLVAQQLKRVIHTHNRHLPKNKWATPGDHVQDDDIDLAA